MERNGEPSPSRSSHDPSQRTVTNLPLDTNAFIQDIFKQQQEILHQQQQSFLQQQEQLITKVLASIGSRQHVGNEHIIDALAKHIQEFHYDPEDAVTFSAWFARYEDLFERDAERLDDAARVRLLLRKLGAAEHERYVSHILPAKLNDFDFRSTTGKLRKLFDSPESVIAKRYRCLQMCKLQEEDYMTYSCRVNKAVIESELGKLSEEELKCLIFVCGLKDDSYSEICIRLLNRLEEKSDKTVTDMAEECKRMVNLKRDTAMIGEGEKSVSIVRGSREKYPKKEHQAWKQSNKPNAIKCWLCGGGHHARKCFHKSYKCNNCHRYGHKEGYCESAMRWANGKKRCVKSVIVNRVNSASRGRVNLFLNNTQIPMMVDTGADISIISSKQWHAIGSPALIPASVKARTASGDPLHILGEFQCDITIGQQCKRFTIRVTEADLMLLGADLMDTFGLWNVPLASICSEINVVEASENTKTLQKVFPALFSSKLGRCTKGCVKLMLKEGVTPVFRPKRPVAYAMLQAVDDELLRLENDGIITRVEYSDWAAPIVVVRKANGTIRICGDYSTGLNNALMAHQYPLPLPEEIFSNLSNCVVFSQIDLSDAFLQVEVDENHRGLLTVNTHRGLFRYNRLPPGVKAAPGAFQQLIDTMLAGLDGVAAYMDDIVVGGKDMATHNGNLRAVLEKLQEYGFTIRANASSIGLGATISHRWPDGKIKVVQHASRALTAAEQRYSQPDREGLAIIFAVTKFHRMLFGRHFLLQTDHQPLLRIFGSKKGIPVYTANRLQRFALTLLLYDFEIEYVPTEKFGNADVLSRLMDKHEKPEQDFIIASIELDNDVGALVKNAAKSLPLAFEHVARESHNDPLLQVVYNYIQSGWPKNIDNAELKYFYARRESLSTIENCICFGERLVIPASQRRRVLEMIHRGHPGIDRMKAIARSYVYWPLIDADVEKLVKLCKSCALAAKSPIHSSPISWPKTDAPWQRVHIDYAGPIDGVYFLLVIDSFSKWPEIISTSSISANATVTMLRGLCVRFGMPNTIVSDNGRQFTSAIFADFCNTNGIEHMGNGQAERFVDSFKRALKR
ncbi:uncharacterized protein K02A2.6-like [Anopheles merus]|uniref:uncharacterized protein K02A2.6-like n=1 Tax=Anopheles merus TaxID=30066 RepID=UPI001BE448F8|nr:uncharacterized protein K02A2.6-like [Anopheles merus]